MKVAVTYDNGEVFQHFGHTKQFKIYDIQSSEIINEQIVNTEGNGHGALADFLRRNNVEVLICGGIGGGAKNALAEVKIKLYGGVTGSADEAVNDFIMNTLKFNPNIHCDHHNHEHTDSDHDCGSHSCGRHGCH